jgi:hypothetical protein
VYDPMHELAAQVNQRPIEEFVWATEGLAAADALGGHSQESLPTLLDMAIMPCGPLLACTQSALTLRWTFYQISFHRACLQQALPVRW